MFFCVSGFLFLFFLMRLFFFNLLAVCFLFIYFFLVNVWKCWIQWLQYCLVFCLSRFMLMEAFAPSAVNKVERQCLHIIIKRILTSWTLFRVSRIPGSSDNTLRITRLIYKASGLMALIVFIFEWMNKWISRWTFYCRNRCC